MLPAPMTRRKLGSRYLAVSRRWFIGGTVLQAIYVEATWSNCWFNSRSGGEPGGDAQAGRPPMGSEDFRPEKFFSYHRKNLLVAVAIRIYTPRYNRNPEMRGISRKTGEAILFGEAGYDGI